MGLWGLIKLALIGTLIWLLYRGVKGLLTGSGHKSRVSREDTKEGQVIDTMVKDPQCGTYVPKQEAIRAQVGGEDLYFCSKQCRDAYKNQTDSGSAGRAARKEQD